MSKVAYASGGYTIVEVMIFLAISGLLFVSAILLIGGQQQKTEFATAVRDLDSKIQSSIGDVASGYYNNTGSTTCTATGGVVTAVSAPGLTPQGQDGNCTFIGKIFLPNPNGFDIYSIAGARLDSTGQEKTSLTGSTLFPGVDNYTLPGGITLISSNPVKYINSGMPTNTDSFGFITSFGAYDGSGLKSGSFNTDIYAGFGASVIAVNSNLHSGTWQQQNPDGGVEVCITDGSQVGVITINGNTTHSVINQGNTCS